MFPPPILQVDERLNGDGTGLIFGINDESLGFILLTIPVLVFGAFYGTGLTLQSPTIAHPFCLLN